MKWVEKKRFIITNCHVNGWRLVGNQEFIVEAVIGDAAKAITSAVKKCFPPSTRRIMCYFHVKKNMKTELSGRLSRYYDEVMSDVSYSHLAVSTEEFRKVTTLMLKKWRTREDLRHFADWFEESWVESELCNWYSGVSRHPKTNCGLESINGVLKTEETGRVRFPIRRFLPKMKTIIEHWGYHSVDVQDTIIPVKQYQKSWVFFNNKPTIIDVNDSMIIFKPEMLNVTSEAFKIAATSRQERNWKTFKDYQKSIASAYLLELKEGKWSCSCYMGIKKQVSFLLISQNLIH